MCLTGAALAAGAARAQTRESHVSGNAEASPFKTRGVYFHDGFTVEPRHHAPLYWGEQEWRRQVAWMRACGINTIEFATMFEFNRIPSTDLERRKIADRLRLLDLAHELGMKFGYILSNTAVSTVPAHEEPGDQLKNRAVMLCPREPGNFEKTTAIQSWYMNTYREADFFEEFAADWGGCTCGRCTSGDFMRYVRHFADQLATVNPLAKLYANTWCISYWGPDPIPLGWKTVFDREIVGSREVIAMLADTPSNVHLALPCHHLYRALVFSVNGSKAATPVFPTAADLEPVKRAGREILAWPHFVMDDDTGRAPQWGLVHCEFRYIRDLLRNLRSAAIDSVMGNLYLPWLQLANTYAYGRLLDDPDASVERLLLEFSRLIAVADDVERLAEVLAWFENNSYWEQQHPEDARLPHVACGLTRDTVMAAARAVRAHPAPDMPLPYPPDRWLDDLRRSIDRMTWAV